MQRRANRLDTGGGAFRLGGDEHDLRAGIARAASGLQRGGSTGFVGDRDDEAASRRSEAGLERIAAGEHRVGQRVANDGLSRSGGMFTGATPGEEHRFAGVDRHAEVRRQAVRVLAAGDLLREVRLRPDHLFHDPGRAGAQLRFECHVALLILVANISAC